jgi:hypothetical protein
VDISQDRVNRSGSIQNPGAQFTNRGAPALLPILAAFRGTAPALAPYVLSRYRPTGKQDVIGGHTCIELIRPIAQHSDHLWLDSERDYVPVVSQLVDAEQPTSRMEIQYQRERARNLWVPASWQSVSHQRKGTAATFLVVDKVEYEFNVPIHAKDLDIEFPPGTNVLDFTGEGKAK